MTPQDPRNGLCWDQAAGLIDRSAGKQEPLPKGVLVPDTQTKRDKVVVVYQQGSPPPEITVHEVSGTVCTVHADGVAVAVVARANGPDLTPEDVLLVERVV